MDLLETIESSDDANFSESDESEYEIGFNVTDEKIVSKEEPDELFREQVKNLLEDDCDIVPVEKLTENVKFGEDRTREIVQKTQKKGKKEDVDSESENEYDEEYFQVPKGQEEKKSFHDLHISKPLLRAIEEMHYEHPTPIQSQAIPYAMNGQDICASAKTGSGKTAAFLLPTFERLLYRNRKQQAHRVVILLPTRELANQCFEVANQLSEFTDIKCCLITGGVSEIKQRQALKTNPDVIVATPGRLVDHLLNFSNFKLNKVEILILDEADRLLEMGFTDEVHHIVKSCPVSRQTMLFSATMTDNVEDLIKLSLKQPIRIAIDSRKEISADILQEFIRVRSTNEEFKFRESALVSICTRLYKKRTIIFTNRKCDARRLKCIFFLLGLRASELHGNIPYEVRLAELDRFKEGYTDFLICTDVGSRGIDIEGVECVINFYMPFTLKTYIHRVGRTGRAGKTGTSLSFTAEDNRNLLKRIVRHAKQKGDTLRHRVIDSKSISFWQEKIESLEPKINSLLKQSKVNDEIRKTDITLSKIKESQSLTKSDILSQPQRTWFQSKEERKNVQKKSRDLIGIDKSGLKKVPSLKERESKLKNKNRQKYKDLQASRKAIEKSDIKDMDKYIKSAKHFVRRGKDKLGKFKKSTSEPKKSGKKRKASNAFESINIPDPSEPQRKRRKASSTKMKRKYKRK